MARFRVSRRAKDDLLEIWVYVAADSAANADRLHGLLHRKFTSLADSPYMGRGRPELGPGIRSFPVGNYVVFYRVFPDRIEMVRVLSRFRDINALF